MTTAKITKQGAGSYYAEVNGKRFHIDRRYKAECGYAGWAVGECSVNDEGTEIVDYADVAHSKAQAIRWAVEMAQD